MTLEQWLPIVGAASFGTVVGWMAHVTLAQARTVNVKWLVSMIGALAGGAIIAIFSDKLLFGAYSVGLAVAFFARAVLAPIGEAVSAEYDAELRKGKGRGASLSNPAGGAAPDQRP